MPGKMIRHLYPIFLIGCLMFVSKPVWAASPQPIPSYSRIGYALSIGGTSYLADTVDDISSVGLSLLWQPFGWTFLDPVLSLEADLGFDGNLLAVHDLRLDAQFSFFRTINHPFGLLMPQNRTVWAPSVSVGLQYGFAQGFPWSWKIAAAPLRLMEKDAMYAWFSPFIVLGTNGRMAGWGVTLFRFTFMVW